MGRQIKSDGREFLGQFFHRHPVTLIRQFDRVLGKGAFITKHRNLIVIARLHFALGNGDDFINMLQHDFAVGCQTVQRTGTDKVFKQAFVDCAAIDARCKIGKVFKRPVGFALGNQAFHRRIADIADCRQCIADFTAALVVFDREGDLRMVDAGRQNFDFQPFDFLLEHRKFFGVVHIKRHQRGHEFDRIVGL